MNSSSPKSCAVSRLCNLSGTAKPETISNSGRTTSEVAEGVGFEPTVSFPTLDFESSALNRTQPPFRGERYYGRTGGICNRNRAWFRSASDRRKVADIAAESPEEPPIELFDRLAADSFRNCSSEGHSFVTVRQPGRVSKGAAFMPF